jgi:hypothetical protein
MELLKMAGWDFLGKSTRFMVLEQRVMYDGMISKTMNLTKRAHGLCMYATSVTAGPTTSVHLHVAVDLERPPEHAKIF